MRRASALIARSLPGYAAALVAVLPLLAAAASRLAGAAPPAPPAALAPPAAAAGPVSPGAASGPAAPAVTLDSLPSRFATLGGRKVHYKVAGEGPATIVLVHGWTCDLTFFGGQLPLASRYRLLLVDLPGHGLSEKPAAYSMDLFARAVAAAMDDAKVPSAVLAGHSMGTPVVRQFWRLFPKRTAGLVALDGSFRSFFKAPGDEKGYLAALEGPGGRQTFLERVDGMLPASMPAAERDFVRGKMASTPQDVVAGAAAAMFDPAIWKDDGVGVPLLSILAKSPFWDEAYRGYVRRLNPGAEFLDLEGVSHFLMLEKPAQVNEAISRFAARAR